MAGCVSLGSWGHSSLTHLPMSQVPSGRNGGRVPSVVKQTSPVESAHQPRTPLFMGASGTAEYAKAATLVREIVGSIGLGEGPPLRVRK